jgi:hypothetical protein
VNRLGRELQADAATFPMFLPDTAIVNEKNIRRRESLSVRQLPPSPGELSLVMGDAKATPEQHLFASRPHPHGEPCNDARAVRRPHVETAESYPSWPTCVPKPATAHNAAQALAGEPPSTPRPWALLVPVIGTSSGPPVPPTEEFLFRVDDRVLTETSVTSAGWSHARRPEIPLFSLKRKR